MINNSEWMDYGDGIYAFDALYERPQCVALHLMVSQGQIALIDTGSFTAVARVLAAIKRLGARPEDVRYLCLTHVHLDHAGAAGQLMDVLPNATLVVHPRGARHMADPTQLIAGVIAVYGEAFYQRVYGTLVPVDQARILAVNDLQQLTLGDRQITCLDTPGHAKHHLCYLDQQSGCIFSGDTFGLSYREMDIGERQFVFPTTTPTQFEPEKLHQSIDRLMSYAPPAIFQTHYSRINFVSDQAENLHRLIDTHVNIAQSHAHLPSGESRSQSILADLSRLIVHDASDFGSSLSDEYILRLWGIDLQLNAQGLDSWLAACSS